ncbi:TonB-dependent siderophore receptor [Hyphococcus sp.]|uniref:TonB-dependent siderophore receptor n=1 Tax=Hyphococcus sp. TaxID=2038636 RepID=UPI003CCB8CBD
MPINPEELPFTLDIIDADLIYERAFINPFDVLETLPNVFRRQTQLLPSSGGYNIRGLNATVLTNNRPEGGSRGAGRRDVSYIERIEVAKGPASIIHGPIIPGGVINQVTKSPEGDDFLNLVMRGGSYGTYRVQADANIASPFGADALGFRITGAYEDQRSPQDPEYTETIAIRPVLEIDFSDRTRAQASIAYTKREGVPSSRFAVNDDGSVPDTIDETTYFGVPSEQGGEDLYYDAEVQHEFLDDLKLVLRGSYQDADFDYQSSQNSYNYAGGRGFSSGDTIAYTYYSRGFRNQDVAYGDAQLQGGFAAFGLQQDWVIGGSYRWENFENDWGFGGVLGAVDVTDLSTASYLTPDFDSIVLSTFQDHETTLSSVYGETSLRPFDRFTVVAGVRYDNYERKDFRRDTVSEAEDVTFRVGGTYALTDGLNAYVSYAESFIPQSGSIIRAGESYTDVNAASDPIDPETATNYEIGLKGSLLDDRVTLTAAAFMLTRQNVATADPNNLPGSPSYVVATGEQEHNGFELGAAFAIEDGFDLNLSYGYVDAEVTEVINPGNGQDVGDTVALTPSHTFSAYGTYTVQSGRLADLRIGAGVRGISERPAPRHGIVYDGYTLVDANVSYPLNEMFEVQVNVHNLLDEEYRDTIGFDNGTAGGSHRFGNPRSAYVTVRANF